MNVQPIRLGLTGGIGSGKSTVARRLQQRNVLVVDADAIARSCTEPGGAAIDAIRVAFGDQSIQADGAMNRAYMRQRVFDHPDQRRQLEAIIHPIVASETAKAIAVAGARHLVFDVPLLVESGHWRARVDYVWIVDCSVETQLTRVRARNGWSDEQIHAVIDQQATRRQRTAAADAVIFNDGINLSTLDRTIDILATQFGL